MDSGSEFSESGIREQSVSGSALSDDIITIPEDDDETQNKKRKKSKFYDFFHYKEATKKFHCKYCRYKRTVMQNPTLILNASVYLVLAIPSSKMVQRGIYTSTYRQSTLICWLARSRRTLDHFLHHKPNYQSGRYI